METDHQSANLISGPPPAAPKRGKHVSFKTRSRASSRASSSTNSTDTFTLSLGSTSDDGSDSGDSIDVDVREIPSVATATRSVKKTREDIARLISERHVALMRSHGGSLSQEQVRELYLQARKEISKRSVFRRPSTDQLNTQIIDTPTEQETPATITEQVSPPVKYRLQATPVKRYSRQFILDVARQITEQVTPATTTPTEQAQASQPTPTTEQTSVSHATPPTEQTSVSQTLTEQTIVSQAIIIADLQERIRVLEESNLWRPISPRLYPSPEPSTFVLLPEFSNSLTPLETRIDEVIAEIAKLEEVEEDLEEFDAMVEMLKILAPPPAIKKLQQEAADKGHRSTFRGIIPLRKQGLWPQTPYASLAALHGYQGEESSAEWEEEDDEVHPISFGKDRHTIMAHYSPGWSVPGPKYWY